MHWIVDNIAWAMGISGALTLSMLLAFVAPRAALGAMFGESLEGPLAGIVVRSWGSMIALGGAMLVWGAFHPAARPLVLVYTGLGKSAFIALVVAHGRLRGRAALVCAADLAMVCLFAWYLLVTRGA